MTPVVFAASVPWVKVNVWPCTPGVIGAPERAGGERQAGVEHVGDDHAGGRGVAPVAEAEGVGDRVDPVESLIEQIEAELHPLLEAGEVVLGGHVRPTHGR